MNARREWAQRLIDAAPGPRLRYGSPEWLRLPEGDPRKVAAVVIAAECWALDGDEMQERLRVEVLALSRAYKQAADAEYVANYEAWRERWAGGVFHPDPDLPAQLEAEFRDWVRGAA